MKIARDVEWLLQQVWRCHVQQRRNCTLVAGRVTFFTYTTTYCESKSWFCISQLLILIYIFSFICTFNLRSQIVAATICHVKVCANKHHCVCLVLPSIDQLRNIYLKHSFPARFTNVSFCGHDVAATTYQWRQWNLVDYIMHAEVALSIIVKNTSVAKPTKKKFREILNFRST